MMWKDVEEYIRMCPTCQMTNDVKFQKAPAPLHPIAVRSKVWHQASHMIIYTDHNYKMNVTYRLESTSLALYQRHPWVIATSLP